MLTFPDPPAPAALRVSSIWIGNQLEMPGTKLSKEQNQNYCSNHASQRRWI